ncbi:MAG: pyridoxamine 5'-phosphate oxidase family protein [Dehalococcoidia bacterium]|nr:pyridoxamine 5'-phosphate oxidase family protein [Dehalococcoidia bacterium]
MWFALHEGELIVSTPADGTKANNVRANGRVSFIVDSRERPYSGVAIEGTARVVEDPGGELWRYIAVRYLGEPLPAEMVQRFQQRERAIIRIIPSRARPWNLGEA